jgi:hypothetical protein
MINKEFLLWINGYFLLSDDLCFDRHRLTIIKNHANLVKAVAGELDNPIKEFLEELELMMNGKQQIPLDEVKQLAKKHEIFQHVLG